MRRLKKVFLVLLFAFLIINVSVIISVPARQKLDYGVTFSQKFAEELGLDPKKLYTEILDDLKTRDLRLIAYWDRIESEEGGFSFDDLDWQIAEAEKRGAKIILAMGKKTPRWPECHEPNWLGNLVQNEKLLNYIKTTVEHYKNSPAITAWQVENEPLFPFGTCSSTSINFLNKEIELVRSLDARPIMLTDSGELGFMWPYLSIKSDIFGTTLYRQVKNERLGEIKYWFIPAYYFRIKAWWANKVLGGEILISELQAEPWVTTLISNVPLEEQYRTMNPEVFKEIIDYAERSGFPKAYLWGVEWWYWLREKKNMPEMWETAKPLFNTNQQI